MRQILLGIIALLLGISNTYAKWELVDSLYYPSKSDGRLTTRYKTIDCYDNKNCISFLFVGDQSTRTRLTSDGGETWHTYLQDTIVKEYHDYDDDYDVVYRPQRPFNIHYQSQNLCIALCDSGCYWRSTDSCHTWKKHKIDTDKSLLHIDFADDQFGVVCNYNDAYLTEDGGETWALIDNIPDIKNGALYQDVNVLSEDEIIFLAFQDDKEDYVLRTTNGGISWDSFDGISPRVRGIHFFNESEGMSYGKQQIAPGSSIYRDIIQETADGGKTWEVRLDSLQFQKAGLMRLDFADRMHGIAMGTFWKLWKTKDGGKTWILDTTANYPSVNDYFWDIAYPSPDTVYGITARTGKIYRKTDYAVGIAAEPELTHTSVSLYPNPARPGETITIVIEADKPESCTASVYSADGRQVSDSFQFDLRPGRNGIQYQADTDLSPGVYYVITDKGCGVISAKFVVGE